jgi:hypothetical protein
VGGTGKEHVARWGFDGDAVRAALAFEIDFSTRNVCACPTLGAARMAVNSTASAMSTSVVKESLRRCCEHLGSLYLLSLLLERLT